MSDKKGYECPTCGKWHQFPAYVFAHWSDNLVHSCYRCKTEVLIWRGRIIDTQRKGAT